MKKVFISVPMKDKTYGEVEIARERARREVAKLVPDTWSDYHVVAAPITRDDGYLPARSLGKSIMRMGDADAVYFGEGWESARGCQIEHQIAEEYGLRILNKEGSNDE